MVKSQKCKSWVLNNFLNFLFLHSLIKCLDPSFWNLVHPLIRYQIFVICLVFIITRKGKAVPVQAY
jgi:hypothetical protein